MSRKKRRASLGWGGLDHNDPIAISKRLRDQNNKALQSNKPDWEDKYEYGLSDW